MWEIVLQVVNLVLLGVLLVVGAWFLERARRRSREVNDQVEALGRAVGRLEAALGAEEQERARQDAALEGRSGERLEAALGPVTERLVELGRVQREAARVQREAARVARAVAEGQLAPEVAVRLEGHLAELAADLATDEGPEP